MLNFQEKMFPFALWKWEISCVWISQDTHLFIREESDYRVPASLMRRLWSHAVILAHYDVRSASISPTCHIVWVSTYSGSRPILFNVYQRRAVKTRVLYINTATETITSLRCNNHRDGYWRLILFLFNPFIPGDLLHRTCCLDQQ